MQTTEQQAEKLNFDKVWLMFQETDKKFQETDKKFQATDKKFQATDKIFQETDKQFKATDKKLRELERLFTGHWGRLMESLVEGDLVKLLNDRGFAVTQLSPRVKRFYNNRQYEFDLIVENGEEVVVVEVKTTLKPNDVKEFIEELKNFKEVSPKYNNNKVIGAVAYLTDEGNSARMAEKRGLYVIRATGNSATITNSPDFKPRAW